MADIKMLSNFVFVSNSVDNLIKNSENIDKNI